jgi:hypothetical protein
MKNDQLYDPILFVSKIELVTITIVGSFITMKFINALYDNLYEPTIDLVVKSDYLDEYYIKIGKYYIQADTIVKEFIKWLALILILMILYNILQRKSAKK